MNCYVQLYKYIIINIWTLKNRIPHLSFFFHLFKEIHLHHHHSIPNISISSSTILPFPFFINISIKNTILVLFSFIQSFWTIYIFLRPTSFANQNHSVSFMLLYKMLLSLQCPFHFFTFFIFPLLPFYHYTHEPQVFLINICNS